MISIEMKVKVLDGYLADAKITDKLLQTCGFNKDDINEWISKDILTIKKNKTLFSKTEYELSKNEVLYIIKTLYDMKKFDIAVAYTKIVYSKNIINKDLLLRLILNEINNHDYNIWGLLKDLELMDDGKYLNDVNFYRLLLSYITDVPEEYQDLINNITFNDIKATLENDDYYKLKIMNEVRCLCLKQKFTFAFAQFRNFTEEIDDRSIETRITRNLIFHINKIKEEYNSKLLNLVKNKNYPEIIAILNKENGKRSLRQFEIEMNTLCEVILETDKTNTLPYMSHVGVGNTFFAIDRGDYETALLCATYTIEQYHAKDTARESSKLVYYLLLDLNNLIEEIRLLNEKITIVLNEHFNGNDNILDDYLKEINAYKYKDLIRELLIISSYKLDNNYNTVLPFFVGLARKGFDFDYKSFITLYEKALEDNDAHLAKLYYNVLLEANTFNLSMENQKVIKEYLEEHMIKESFEKQKSYELKYEKKS